jgi:hypothetical protein
VRGAPPVAIRRFRLAAVALLALLAVVVASALERMRLYVTAFGLTEDRLYATAAMGYVVVLLVWLGWTVLRGRGERFAFGGLVQGLALLAGLHLVNPAALIVRHNVARPGSERPLDVAYASSLSADAAPLVLAMLPRLEGRDACIAAQGLARWAEDEADWRTWNWPRARARRIAHAPEVAAALTRCEPAPSTPTPDP